MSLVVFPFKHEDPAVVRRNLEIATGHDRVSEVWGVAAAQGASLERVMALGAEVSRKHGKPIDVFAQERIGSKRPGKGDGMNTAIRRAVAEGFERIHFYDADITNFDEAWIDGAETEADRGFEIVRHRFPRASTDAMITWMITRPSLAMLYPGTLLPRLGQPLGGELLISGAVAAELVSNELVRTRSDWGIDTMITHATATLGAPMYEHNVADGKRHALYGSLDEIREMVIECLDAARSLRAMPGPPSGARFSADPPADAPEDLKRVVGYDIEQTTPLLTAVWSEEEASIAQQLESGISDEVLANRDAPNFGFMSADVWGDVLAWLLTQFRLEDEAWRSLAFRLWLMRVLAYTTEVVPNGYDDSLAYLEETVAGYEQRPLT
jgi:mannosylglycerate synthase